MLNEIWKDIQGYEGIYQISNYGRIKSLYRKEIRYKNFNNNNPNPFFITRKECILKQQIKRGYYVVNLNKNSIKTYPTVHRLVMLNFNPNDNSDIMQINHIDGNKLNNHIDNLEWCTAKENTIHAYNNGLAKFKDQDGIKNTSSKLTIEQVNEIRKNGKYDSYENISKQYNVSRSTIENVLKNKTYKDIKI